MSPMMNRLADLLGPNLAQRLADEFGGQTVYFPPSEAVRKQLRHSGRTVDCGGGFLILERTPEESAAVEAAILAEFNGVNHVALAHHYRVSLQCVYRLVRDSRLQSVSLALRQVSGIEAEVVWASPLAETNPLSVLEAGLQAFETAKSKILAEPHTQGNPSVMHRLLVAVAVLPPTHPAVLAANKPPTSPVAPAESQPGIPAHPDSSPMR